MDYKILIQAAFAFINGVLIYYFVKKDKQKDKQKDDVEHIKDSLKNLSYRVNTLENEAVTGSRVEKLLNDKVAPLEKSLQLLESEMRKNHEDLSREFRESNQETREAMHTTHLALLESLSKLSVDVSVVRGKLEARKDESN